jgi:glutathione S-transferase
LQCSYLLYRKKGNEDIIANLVPKHFKFWEDALNANSSQEFIYGDKLTIADFLFLVVYSSMIRNNVAKETYAAILENFPVLKEYFEKRYNAQKEYFDNRPEYSF